MADQLTSELRNDLREKAKAALALSDSPDDWYQARCFVGELASDAEAEDAAFVAVATPSVVLALLDEAEQLRSAMPSEGTRIVLTAWVERSEKEIEQILFLFDAQERAKLLATVAETRAWVDRINKMSGTP